MIHHRCSVQEQEEAHGELVWVGGYVLVRDEELAVQQIFLQSSGEAL
uniref:Uncharacterized protein n=1 Tax=Rhizophora mucronata TaxID=61149 RepID=A0A2P2IW04_RHIMU